jgi:hypothetical protein
LPAAHRSGARARATKSDDDALPGSLARGVDPPLPVNRLYLINEKGGLAGAARLPLTVANLTERVKSVWQALGLRAFDAALTELRSIERELAGLVEAAR